MDHVAIRVPWAVGQWIFVRVNSLGAKLRSSDLALAQITAKWRHSLEAFQKFQADCAKVGFDLELGIHLRNIIAFATGQSRFRTVGNLTVEALKKAWKEAGEGMEFAINFLKSNVGIESPALLSSPFLMVVIALFRARSRIQDLNRGIRSAALLGFGRERKRTLLAGIERDLSRSRPGVAP
jgi:hypothetical protein